MYTSCLHTKRMQKRKYAGAHILSQDNINTESTLLGDSQFLAYEIIKPRGYLDWLIG